MLKRSIDIIGSIVGLIIFIPLALPIVFLIRMTMGAPVLFRQQRPGIKGSPFKLIKFRTMKEEFDLYGNLLPDSTRLTKMGRWLRRYSIDEVPEFINVLKGDMSLVGPRPLLMQYMDRYSSEQARRHEVKPGITGWAQVNGRNAITWEEKFALDVWYVDNRSFFLDLKILAMTAWKVLKREGISAEGEATMPEFMGSVTTSGKSENA